MLRQQQKLRVRYPKQRKTLRFQVPVDSGAFTIQQFLKLYVLFLHMYMIVLKHSMKLILASTQNEYINSKKRNGDFLHQGAIANFMISYEIIMKNYKSYLITKNHKIKEMYLNNLIRESEKLNPVFNDLFEFLGSISNTFIFRNVTINDRVLSMINRGLPDATAKEIKQIHKYISRFFITYYRIYSTHYGLGDNVYGFVKNRSCVNNAQYHLANKPKSLINIDINKFFNNCTIIKAMKNRIFTDTIDLFDAPSAMKTSLNLGILSLLGYCTHNSVFPTGASFTPVLSNIMLLPIDVDIKSYIEQLAIKTESSIKYSRYADDISVSSNRTKINNNHVLNIDVIKSIESILNSYGFYVKYKKTLIAGPGDKKTINNIVLDVDNGRLSIGTDKKLMFKTILSGDESDDDEKDYVIANLPYIKDISIEQYNYIRKNNDIYCT